MKHGPLSYGLVAVSSAGLGLGIGVLLCRHLINRQHEEQLAFEVRNLKNHYDQKAKALEEHFEEQFAKRVKWYERRANNAAVASLIEQVSPPDGDGEFDVAGGQDVAGGEAPTPSPASIAGRERVEKIIHRMRYDRVIDSGIELDLVPAQQEQPDEGGEEPVDITVPHVVSLEAYCNDDPDWTRTSLTYYAGDNALIDERDNPVEDILGAVGENLLGKFGGVSGDPHSAYIRNARLELYIEVTLNEGSYKKLVLGEADEEVADHPYPELAEGEPAREL